MTKRGEDFLVAAILGTGAIVLGAPAYIAVVFFLGFLATSFVLDHVFGALHRWRTGPH